MTQKNLAFVKTVTGRIMISKISTGPVEPTRQIGVE